MIFIFCVILSIQLMSLVFGTYLYWTITRKDPSATFPKAVGLVVTVFSIFGILCTTYYGLKYWSAGFFDTPMGMDKMMQDMMKKQDMQKMMQDMMKDQSKKMNPQNQSQPDDHSAHHQ